MVWSKADTENCNRGPKGASASTSRWLWKNCKERRCWRCCRRSRRRSPDIGALGAFLYNGPTTRDAYCERTTRWTPSPFSYGTAGLGRRKATCSFALVLGGVRPLWREEAPSLLAVCQRVATCDCREEPQTAPPHNVARDGGRSWIAEVPTNCNLPK